MEITIRNINVEDIPAVVDIQIEGWKTAYRGIIDDLFLDSVDRQSRIEQRKKDYKDGQFIVAVQNDEIVGFCRYYDNVLSSDGQDCDCEIMALYVKPELKRQGIGKKMLNYAVSDFKNMGRNKMILWCLKENYPSRTFYEKMGGQIIGEHKIEFGGKAYQEVGFCFDIG